jgi:predicted metal-dependent peptidase
MTQLVPLRSTYDHPNRRTAWRADVVFPDNHTKEAAPGCVLADTSLSMSLALMNASLTEMEAILATFTRCDVTLRMADTRLTDYERTFHRWDFPLQIPVEWMGRGGTNLAPAIKEIADSRKYKWIAVVSDMKWDAASCEDPGVPVLWVTTEDITHMPPYSTPTFGQVIGPVTVAQ